MFDRYSSPAHMSIAVPRTCLQLLARASCSGLPFLCDIYIACQSFVSKFGIRRRCISFRCRRSVLLIRLSYINTFIHCIYAFHDSYNYTFYNLHLHILRLVFMHLYLVFIHLYFVFIHFIPSAYTFQDSY